VKAARFLFGGVLRRNICFSAIEFQRDPRILAGLDVDARDAQFDAGPSIPVLVAVAMIALVNDYLVAVALVDTPRPADVLAANLAADLGDWLRDAQPLRRALQAGRTGGSPGRSLTQCRSRESDGRNRQ
jgi:hypothetical protein